MIPTTESSSSIAFCPDGGRQISKLGARLAMFENNKADSAAFVLPGANKKTKVNSATLAPPATNKQRFARRGSTGDIPIAKSCLVSSFSTKKRGSVTFSENVTEKVIDESKPIEAPVFRNGWGKSYSGSQDGPKSFLPKPEINTETLVAPTQKFQRRASTGTNVSPTDNSRAAVQQRRMEAAMRSREKREAIKIQSVFRMYVEKRKVQPILDEARHLRQLAAKEACAALKIQALFRTVVPRLQLKCLKLEKKMQDIEEKRVADLQAVEDKLQANLDLYRQKESKRRAAMFRSEGEMISTECNKIIECFRKENKDLRKKNQKLRDNLKEERQKQKELLEAQSDMDELMEILNERLEQVEATNKKAKKAIAEHEHLIAVWTKELEYERHHCISETAMKEIYGKCKSRIVREIQDRCKDSAFYWNIMGINNEGAELA